MSLTLCFKNSDNFGAAFDVQSRIAAFRFVLEGAFSVEQILSALRIHMERSTEMFKPAHASAILNPPVPKITQAEFIHAKKQWELEGYQQFSYYAGIVRDFEAQEAEEREDYRGKRQDILQIAGNAVRRIGS